MKITAYFFQIIILLICFYPAHFHGQILFYGFFDLNKNHDISKSKFSKLDLGQFELGLENEFSKNLSAAGSIAYNTEARHFEPGTVILNYCLFKFNDKPDGCTNTNLILSAGLFDIPFGLDYKYIASPDRNLISTPLAVQRTINNINDTGILLCYTGGLVYSNIYVTGDFNDEYTFGGRLGLKLYNELEIGGSALFKTNRSNDNTGSLLGLDLKISLGRFQLQSEYINSKSILNGELIEFNSEAQQDGLLLELAISIEEIEFLPLICVMRYCSISGKIPMETNYSPKSERLIFGLSSQVHNNLILKLEYSNEVKKSSKNLSSLAAQLVVSI